jgi:hypothetical protein
MAWEDDFQTYAGTRLWITDARPTDNTETLWEAITTWHEITITSVPNIQGRNYNTSTLSVVSAAHDREKKGSYTLGSIDFGVQWLPTQKGQIHATTLSTTNSIAGFALVYQDGSVSYFSAQVMNFVETGGGSNDARAGTLTLLRQSDTLNATTPTAPTESTGA